jgi:hypothetical protein
MHVEAPITENHVAPFVGLYCGVIMKDGANHYGVVTGSQSGKLLLNGGQSTTDEAGVDSIKKKGKKKSLRTSAKTKKTVSTKADLPESPDFPAPPSLYSSLPQGKSEELSLDSISVLYAMLP